ECTPSHSCPPARKGWANLRFRLPPRIGCRCRCAGRVTLRPARLRRTRHRGQFRRGAARPREERWHMASIRERARGALLGLAVGDALGAPAENLKPSEIRARWGRITGYVTDRPAGTDDTEYTVFSGLL